MGGKQSQGHQVPEEQRVYEGAGREGTGNARHETPYYKIFKFDNKLKEFYQVATVNSYEPPSKAYVHQQYGDGIYVVLGPGKRTIWFSYLSQRGRENFRRGHRDDMGN